MYGLYIYEEARERYEVLVVNDVKLKVPMFYLCSVLFRALGQSFCNEIYNQFKSNIEGFPHIKPISDGNPDIAFGYPGHLTLLTDDEKKVVLSIDYNDIDRPYMLPFSILSGNTEHDSDPMMYIMSEWFSFFFAVLLWLIPKRSSSKPGFYLTTKQRFINQTLQEADNPDLCSALYEVLSRKSTSISGAEEIENLWTETYLDGTFRYRTSSVGSEMFISENYDGESILVHLYKSRSIYSLAWMEIMYAIENNIYAQFCDNCGNIFQLKPPYDRSVYICSEECAKEHRISRLGGPEKLREYNREAQRRSRRTRKHGS